MLEKKTGNPQTIRENNQKVLAQYLFEKGTTSRSKLAEVFRLSSPSIYKNIAQLIEQNIVVEIGEGGSMGGRRPMLIGFNYNLGHIISIDLKGEYLKLVLANLALDILSKEEISIKDYHNEDDLIIKTVETIKYMLNKNKISFNNLLSIAIGFPGAINQETGQVNMPPKWLIVKDAKKIEKMIKEEFPTANIIIKNDTNLAAIGERRYGTGKGCKNLIYVNIDMGVGAGIIINDKLYEGSRFSSGEIGYSKISLDAPNILEDEISIVGITNRIEKDILLNNDERIKDFIIKNKKTLNFQAINKAVEEKNPYILKLMKEITDKLGLILLNICVLLDIELIIIGGKVIDIEYDIKSDLDDILSRNIPVEIKTGFSSLNGDEVIYGGFALSLDHILKEIAYY